MAFNGKRQLCTSVTERHSKSLSFFAIVITLQQLDLRFVMSKIPEGSFDIIHMQMVPRGTTDCTKFQSSGSFHFTVESTSFQVG